MKKLLLLVIIATSMLQCNGGGGEVSSHGGGDDVTTATIYNPDGSFASNCSVTLVPSNAVPGADTTRQFKTVTDTLGRYTFTSLPPDTYNIYVKKDTLVSCTRGVVVGTVSGEKALPDITLGPSGGIRGIVRLSGAADSRTVRIMMIGGTFTTWPEDSSGRFSVSDLAEGTYRFRFLPSDSQYPAADTSFTVAGGEYLDVGIIELTNAGDTVVDPDTVVVRDTVVVTDSLIEGVWGPDTTYTIMNDVKIRAGTRLEIREGTQVVFFGRFFWIEGNCIAHGTATKPVVVTLGFPNNSRGNAQINAGTPGNNRGLQPSIDTVLFDNCILEQFYAIVTGADHPDFYFAMTNCVVRHINSGLHFSIMSGMELNSGKGFYIRNNVFHNLPPVDPLLPDTMNCTSRGFWVGSSDYETWRCNDPCVQVTDNIFYHLCWNSTDAIVYSCYFPYNCYTSEMIDIPYDSTCVYGAPLFMDISNGDYRLQPNSPCIGAGKGGVDMGLNFTDTNINSGPTR